MQVQFITSVAIIAPDPPASRRLYLDTLGLPLEQLDEDYFASEHIAGSKHFGVWPLSQAARACYGTPDWPRDVPVPQASIEFEVANANAVTDAAQDSRRRATPCCTRPAPNPGAKRSPASSPQKNLIHRRFAHCILLLRAMAHARKIRTYTVGPTRPLALVYCGVMPSVPR